MHGFYEDCIEDTESDEKIKSRLHKLENFYMYWSGCFVHGMEEDIGRVSNLSHNIFIYFSASKTMEFDWMCSSIKVGHYDLCLRELINILEGLVLTYTIENNPRVNKIGEKIRLWRDMEEEYKAHGVSVFKSSDLEDWEKYYEIYKDLCKYTHPSVETAGEDTALMAWEGSQSQDFSYSRDRFLNCYTAWFDVSEAAENIAQNLYSNYPINPTEFNPNYFSDLRDTDFDLDSKANVEEFIPSDEDFEP